ncbi:MAG: hypothetical protein Q8Q62_19460 [Mesorhizobium sp.]|nr:hypothetical protein [Mesorhizobium sp.]
MRRRMDVSLFGWSSAMSQAGLLREREIFEMSDRPFFAGLTIMVLALQPDAFAQDRNVGIAFAYAPEQASGVCVGGSPDKAFACARQKCVDGGAAAADCARVAWCFPAGWSAAVGVMHKEGIHWTEFTCGWQSREAALAAADIRCDTAQRPYIQECALGGLWDDSGKEIPVE